MTHFIDIGVNLMSPVFDGDRTEVLLQAARAGVTTVIITGSGAADSLSAAEFAKNHNGACRGNCRLYTTAGFHPHNAKHWNEEAAALIEKLVTAEGTAPGKKTVAAVGECGLDYNRNFSPPEDQQNCFERQLELAAALGKPVFLHERDAFDDFFAILQKYRPRLPGAVVHCFTGGTRELEAYLDMDCYVGITGWLCDERRGGHLAEIIGTIPSGRLLLETDAPYLLPRTLPRPLRGKSGRNEPLFLPHITARAAAILKKPLDLLAAETSENAVRLFGLEG